MALDDKPPDSPAENANVSESKPTASADADETADMSESKPTVVANPDEIELRAREEYSRHHSAIVYRWWFDSLYPQWRKYNADYFDSRLRVPRISIAPSNPRRLSETRLNTDYGATTNIVLGERMVFGTDRKLVRTDEPHADGLIRLVADRLLGESVKQCVMELHGSTEDGWDGYGPLYAREATRIGAMIGLPEVHPRRRGPRLAGQPVAATWPHAFRPDGYYLGHIRFDHLRLRGRHSTPTVRQTVVAGVYEYFHFLLTTGKTDRLTEILGREVDAAKVARSPALADAERNPRGPSGKPLPMPVVDPAWLAWNGGCVKNLAEGIRTRRAFDGMPILADALQDAGCEDKVLLGHLRAWTEHTANCWALKLLTEPASD